MIGNKGVYLLVFLLLSASTDDIWAAAVAPLPQSGLADDDDGEFLPPARPQQRRRSPLRTGLVSPEAAAELVSLPLADARPVRPARSVPPVRGGPGLLYALMSLQR